MRARVLVLLAVMAAAQAAPNEARAQGKRNPRAEALNAEGKKRIKELDLEGAAEKFRQAMNLSRDPRYAFNLCYTLERSGRLEEARAACLKARASSDERLAKKAAQLLATIEEKLGSAQTTPPGPRPPGPRPPGPTPAGPTPAGPTPAGPTPAGPTPPGSATANGSATPAPPPPPPLFPAEEDETKKRFGGVLGIVSANFSGGADTSPIFGYAAGGWYLLKSFSVIDLVAEAQLVQRGTSLFFESDFRTAEVNLTYLDLGAALRFALGSGGTLPYFEIGSTASLLLASSTSLDGMDFGGGDFSVLDLGMAVGVGYRFGPVDTRVRWVRGLIEVADGASSKNSATLLQVGYWF